MVRSKNKSWRQLCLNNNKKKILTNLKSLNIFCGHIFYDHNEIKLEINKRKKPGKIYKYVEINTLLNNQWVKEETKGKL